MVLEIGEYLGKFKDMVIFFGGIIIEVVKLLENDGFCFVVINVV